MRSKNKREGLGDAFDDIQEEKSIMGRTTTIYRISDKVRITNKYRELVVSRSLLAA
jgi:hypothetical protein